MNTYLPQKSNSRFKEEEKMGGYLNKFRSEGPLQRYVDCINSKEIEDSTQIPESTTYTVYKNKIRCAINEAVFKKYLEKNHTNNP